MDLNTGEFSKLKRRGRNLSLTSSSLFLRCCNQRRSVFLIERFALVNRFIEAHVERRKIREGEERQGQGEE